MGDGAFEVDCDGIGLRSIPTILKSDLKFIKSSLNVAQFRLF